MSSPGNWPRIPTGFRRKGPIMTNARRETATLIIGALMLFGAAATVAEAQERAHERTMSVSEPAPVPSATHPGL